MRYWLLLLALVPVVAPAQGPNPAALAARAWRQQHERAIVDELVALLGIPNIARDRQNIERNAAAIRQMMERRGITASVTGCSKRVSRSTPATPTRREKERHAR